MVKLFAPVEYKTANPLVKKNICNGCGSANSKFDFVPDNLLGLDISESCNIHDWMYEFGENIEDKKKADRVFLNNMLRLVNNKSCWLLKGVRRRLAKRYFQAVKYFGGSAFWDGKNKDCNEVVIKV